MQSSGGVLAVERLREHGSHLFYSWDFRAPELSPFQRTIPAPCPLMPPSLLKSASASHSLTPLVPQSGIAPRSCPAWPQTAASSDGSAGCPACLKQAFSRAAW